MDVAHDSGWVATCKVAWANLVLALRSHLQRYLHRLSHAASQVAIASSSFNCRIEMLPMALMTNRSQRLP